MIDSPWPLTVHRLREERVSHLNGLHVLHDGCHFLVRILVQIDRIVYGTRNAVQRHPCILQVTQRGAPAPYIARVLASLLSG